MLQSSAKRLSSIWTKHLETSKQEDFEDTIRRSSVVLRRLKAILEEELQQVQDADCTIKDLQDNASWTYLQAARIGEKTQLKRILQLLDFLN